jgi:hypothetical protein
MGMDWEGEGGELAGAGEYSPDRRGAQGPALLRDKHLRCPRVVAFQGAGCLRELAMPGRKKQLCGARTRRGTACRCKALANGRCRLHGGLSTGPKTLRGKMKAFQNLRQYRALPSQGVYEVLDLLERKGYTPATGGVNKPGR